LYPPAAGRIVRFNSLLLDDPSAINTSNYEEGWLYDFETEAGFMSPQDYVDFLATKWEETQRVIKGQLND
ncbi:MAG: glycine cleavage system protein H, partial [Planctomycetaceae bacterium]|nr:glycine cleavage system protein H [Planctomycetaceae bacterium]